VKEKDIRRRKRVKNKRVPLLSCEIRVKLGMGGGFLWVGGGAWCLM
jgi:hypothetical protein